MPEGESIATFAASVLAAKPAFDIKPVALGSDGNLAAIVAPA
jgi:hypothetical protein